MKTILVRMGEALSSIQWKQLIAASFVGILLLTTQIPTQIADANLDSSTQNRLEEVRAKGEQGRPRTTGQWQSEKESLSGQPGKVIERMGKEASDAVGNVADTYGQTLKDVTPGLESNELPKDK
jgi:hypothetical protein